MTSRKRRGATVAIVAAMFGVLTFGLIGVSSADEAAPAACWDHVTIQSYANGQYIASAWDRDQEAPTLRASSAEVAGPGRWEVGDAETFRVCRNPRTGLTYMLSEQQGSLVRLWRSDNRLAVNGDAYGYTPVDLGTFFYTFAPPTGTWTLIESASNRMFVSAEVGYAGNDYGVLRARDTEGGPWEWFYWKGDPAAQ